MASHYGVVHHDFLVMRFVAHLLYSSETDIIPGNNICTDVYHWRVSANDYCDVLPTAIVPGTVKSYLALEYRSTLEMAYIATGY